MVDACVDAGFVYCWWMHVLMLVSCIAGGCMC